MCQPETGSDLYFPGMWTVVFSALIGVRVGVWGGAPRLRGGPPGPLPWTGVRAGNRCAEGLSPSAGRDVFLPWRGPAQEGGP